MSVIKFMASMKNGADGLEFNQNLNSTPVQIVTILSWIEILHFSISNFRTHSWKIGILWSKSNGHFFVRNNIIKKSPMGKLWAILDLGLCISYNPHFISTKTASAKKVLGGLYEIHMYV